MTPDDITRLAERVEACVYNFRSQGQELTAIAAELRTLAQQQGNAGGVAEKYDDVLLPFLAMMRAELHANAGKGDRPGWLRMSTDTCLLEIYYHLAKLQKAVRDDSGNAICEHAADVANMAMMLVDICGGLEAASQPPANPPESGVTVVGWINEDELPDNYPYDAMFPHSRVDGVRLFPVFAPPAHSPDAGVTGTVADISDEDLLHRAMNNLAPRARRQPAWARISDVFGLGSTYSAQLCRRFGIDPETGKALAPQPKDAT